MKYTIYTFLFLSSIACSHSPSKPTADRISDSDGRVVARYSGNKVETYVYGKESRKIEKSVVVNTLSGNVLTSDYFYENGMLGRVEKSNGEKINLQHDSLGRISKLVSTGDVIEVQYDNKVNKPSLIRKADGSSLTIRYKANGEIDKVEKAESEI